MKNKKWMWGVAALALATCAPQSVMAREGGEHHGDNRPTTPVTQFTDTQRLQLRAALLTRDAAIIAAEQAYFTAEQGVLANNGAVLTTAQEQTLKTAAQTEAAAIKAAEQTYEQTVRQILHPATTTAVTASSGEASVSRSLVRLRFSGALDQTSAATVANYAVTVNGTAVTVQGANYSTDSRSVVLGLATGVLKAGDAVVVNYTGLKDLHGTAVAGSLNLTAH